MKLHGRKGVLAAFATAIRTGREPPDFPSGRSRSEVQQQAIDVIQKRINSIGVNEPQINGVGSSNDQIEVRPDAQEPA